MFIPNDMRDDMHREETAYSKRRMKTLFLLHGYTGAAYNWVPEYLAEKYNFAIVMPNGENSFWLDGLSTGRKFCTFVGEELVGYVRKTFGLAMDAQETYIMGFSMGGFGALHTAFAYPENFGKVGALSSALIVHEIAHMKEGGDNGVANYDYYHECFGDLEVVEESDNNPETLIKDYWRIKRTSRKSICAVALRIFCCKRTEIFMHFWIIWAWSIHIMRVAAIMTGYFGMSMHAGL